MDLPTFVIFVLVFGLSLFFDISPVLFVAASGVAGAVLGSLGVGKK